MCTWVHTQSKAKQNEVNSAPATQQKSNEAKAMNVMRTVRFILLINCNLLSFQ